MAGLDDVIQLVREKYPNDAGKQDRAAELTAECWITLEPEVKQAYLVQLDSDTIGKPTLKAGVADFAEDMSRAVNSFSDNQEALENFQNLNRSKHSLELPLFDNASLMTSINSYPDFAKNPAIAAGMITQVSTLTSNRALDQDALNKATTNIIIGLVTNKSITGSRSLDTTKINKFGVVHPDLVIAAANYAKENLESLQGLDQKAQRNIGGQIKKASSALSFESDASKSQMLATKEAFNTVTPPAATTTGKRHSVSAIKTDMIEDLPITAPNTPDGSPKAPSKEPSIGF